MEALPRKGSSDRPSVPVGFHLGSGDRRVSDRRGRRRGRSRGEHLGPVLPHAGASAERRHRRRGLRSLPPVPRGCVAHGRSRSRRLPALGVLAPGVAARDGRPNEAGLAFYDRLVDELLACGIDPFITLYHWDLPQALEDAGGWPVRATAEAFGEYAALVAGRLGDRVGHFATLNEPHIVSDHGYRVGSHAPGRTEPEAALAAAHHLLVAHALGVQAIRAEAPRAAAGIVLNFEPKHAATPHPLDQEAAAVKHDQFNRWYLDPITGHGYPEEGARAWGWRRDEVLDGDMEAISAPLDFLGRELLLPGDRAIAVAPSARAADGPTRADRHGMGGLPGGAHRGARVRGVTDRATFRST